MSLELKKFDMKKITQNAKKYFKDKRFIFCSDTYIVKQVQKS